MPVSEASLIEALLHNAKASGGKPLETRMADLTIWFYKNMEHIPLDNLAARQAFLQKAFWIQLEINALLLERMRDLKGASALWIPNGMLVDGADVKAFS